MKRYEKVVCSFHPAPLCLFFLLRVFFFSLFYSSIKNNHMIMAKNDNSNKYVNNDCTVYATFI